MAETQAGPEGATVERPLCHRWIPLHDAIAESLIPELTINADYRESRRDARPPEDAPQRAVSASGHHAPESFGSEDRQGKGDSLRHAGEAVRSTGLPAGRSV